MASQAQRFQIHSIGSSSVNLIAFVGIESLTAQDDNSALCIATRLPRKTTGKSLYEQLALLPKNECNRSMRVLQFLSPWTRMYSVSVMLGSVTSSNANAVDFSILRDDAQTSGNPLVLINATATKDSDVEIILQQATRWQFERVSHVTAEAQKHQLTAATAEQQLFMNNLNLMQQQQC